MIVGVGGDNENEMKKVCDVCVECGVCVGVRCVWCDVLSVGNF